MKQYSLSYLKWYGNTTLEQAEAAIAQAFEQHPEDAVALHHQRAMQHISNWGSSKAILESANYMVTHGVDADDRSTGYELMGICYEHDLQNIDAAINNYKLSLEHFDKNESALFRLACIYLHESVYGEALSLFLKLQEIDGDSQLLEIADCYIGLGDFDKAETYLHTALEERPNERVYISLGRCAAEKGEGQKAVEYFKKALEIAPDHATANYYMGLMYQKAEDQYRALHHYTKAIKAWPEFSEAYNNMALCYDSLGDDPDTALAHFETALEVAPNPDMRMKLYINLSRYHGQRKNFDQQTIYQMRLMEALGFDVEISEEDDDE